MITCEFEDGGKASLRHAVVDCIVLQDNKVLLAKRSPKLTEGGKWGLVGGFMDRNETIKEAIQREIYEETGWEIDGLTLLSIIDTPNRKNEDRQNVCFLFFCNGIKQTGKPDWESTEIKWFDLKDLPPEQELAFDHAQSIQLYKKYIKEKFSLPYSNY